MATKKTNISSKALISWLNEKRINNTAILDALDQLGANEVQDLLDLEEEDIKSFQPPFLKKLEYLRFRRGIVYLKLNNDQQPHDLSTVDTVATPLPIIASAQTVTSLSSVDELYGGNNNYQHPPLPPECTGEGCTGKLSSYLGSRKNKYLTELDGPDFRWIVSCSLCSRKWHACHFLCGHLQKISTLGSSDIIRHEQGRFNRWQKKIKPPCVNNPKSGVLKARYAHQKNKLKSKMPEEGEQLVFKEKTTLIAKSMDKMDTIITNKKNISNSFRTTDMQIEPSTIINDPIHPQFDSEFKSMIESLDKDTLNFGSEEADTGRMDEEFLQSTSHDKISHHSMCSNNLSKHNSTKDGEEPTNKRIKLSDTAACNKQGDQQIDEICNGMIEKCLIEKRLIESFD